MLILPSLHTDALRDTEHNYDINYIAACETRLEEGEVKPSVKDIAESKQRKFYHHYETKRQSKSIRKT
jgi:hypothetical protein